MSGKARGFTIIELLTAVAIIGVLAAMAIPAYEEYRKRSFDARTLSDLRNAANAEEAYFADFQHYVDCVGAASCESALPAFRPSLGVTVSMFQIPARAPAPEHFTGMAFHPDGARDSIGTAFQWNSQQGGLQ